MTSTESIRDSESRPGFFVGTCEHCGKVIGVKQTREEVQLAKTWHICSDDPTWE